MSFVNIIGAVIGLVEWWVVVVLTGLWKWSTHLSHIDQDIQAEGNLLWSVALSFLAVWVTKTFKPELYQP